MAGPSSTTSKTMHYLAIFVLVAYIRNVYSHIYSKLVFPLFYFILDPSVMKQVLPEMRQLWPPIIIPADTNTVRIAPFAVNCFFAIACLGTMLVGTLIGLEMVLLSTWQTLSGIWRGRHGAAHATDSEWVRDPLVLLDAESRTLFEHLVISTAWFLSTSWVHVFVLFVSIAIQWDIYEYFQRNGLPSWLTAEQVILCAFYMVAVVIYNTLVHQVIEAMESVAAEVMKLGPKRSADRNRNRAVGMRAY